jgi:hypothetical protein
MSYKHQQVWKVSFVSRYSEFKTFFMILLFINNKCLLYCVVFILSTSPSPFSETRFRRPRHDSINIISTVEEMSPPNPKGKNHSGMNIIFMFLMQCFPHFKHLRTTFVISALSACLVSQSYQNQLTRKRSDHIMIKP